MGRAAAKNFWAPPPRAMWRGQKVKYKFNFNYKVNFKDFYTKLYMCTHKCKIQNISDGIIILLSGSCPRGGTWGCLGAKIKFSPAVCPLCYLLLNHWMKFNQIWCVSYSHELDAQWQKNLAPPPGALGRGQNDKYHLISFTKSISKIFIPNFVCVLTNVRYKTYQAGFSFCRLGHALVGLRVLRDQNQIPCCCLSVMLSPPKPVEEIQPNLVCELLT